MQISEAAVEVLARSAVDGVKMVYGYPRQFVPWPGLNTRRVLKPEIVRHRALSIRAKGLRTPLQVTRTEIATDDGLPVYWIVEGATRGAAGELIATGFTYENESGATITVPADPDFQLRAEVGEYTEASALEANLAENIEREDLTAIEIARGYQRLIQEHGYTQAQVAEKFLHDVAKQPQVAHLLGLLDLPEGVQDLIEEKHIAPSAARDFLKPLWNRLDVGRRDDVFRGLVRSIRTLIDTGNKVTGPWLQQQARELESEDQRLRGQADIFGGGRDVAPGGAGADRDDEQGEDDEEERAAAEAADDEGLDPDSDLAWDLGQLTLEALSGSQSARAGWRRLGMEGATDVELTDFLRTLPEVDGTSTPAGGSYRFSFAGPARDPLLSLHPEGQLAPKRLSHGALLGHLRGVFHVDQPELSPAATDPDSYIRGEAPGVPAADLADGRDVEEQTLELVRCALLGTTDEDLDRWGNLQSATDAELLELIAASPAHPSLQPADGIGYYMLQTPEKPAISVVPNAAPPSFGVRPTTTLRGQVLLNAVRAAFGIDTPGAAAAAIAQPAASPAEAPQKRNALLGKALAANVGGWWSLIEQGGTDAQVEAQIATVFGRLVPDKDFAIPGVGTWRVSAKPPRVSLVYDGRTFHVRDAELIAEARRVIGIGQPVAAGASGVAATQSAPATPARPALVPAPKPAPAPAPTASVTAPPDAHPGVAAPPAPVASPPADLPENAGALAATLLAISGGRSITVSARRMESGGDVCVTASVQPVKGGGETAFILMLPSDQIDAQLLPDLYAHYNNGAVPR